jgi:hypothetical protein
VLEVYSKVFSPLEYQVSLIHGYKYDGHPETVLVYNPLPLLSFEVFRVNAY